MAVIFGSETMAAEIAAAESRAAVTETPSEQPKPAVEEPKPAPAAEPEKPAESSETAAESGTVEEGEPDGPSNRSRRAVGREAAKLRRELREQKAKNEDLQRLVESYTGVLERKAQASEAQSSAVPSKPVDPDAEPIETDFENYSDYLRAVGRFEARRAIREEREAAERETAAKAYEERFSKAKERHQDFEDALDAASDIQLPPAAVAAIEVSDDPGEVVYYLAIHPDEAEKLAGMNPVQQAKEIGRIEARISSAGQPPAEQTPTPKPKPTAQALPAPLRPVSSVSGEPPAFDPFTASKDDPRWPAWRLERDKREGRFV